MRPKKPVWLAKAPSHGQEQERGESLEWELPNSGGFSVAGVDRIVLRGLDGAAVCGVGGTGYPMRQCGGS
jgi:hypothetical protein